MTGTKQSPFTEPIPVPGGTLTTSPSPFVTAQSDAEAVKDEPKTVVAEVEDDSALLSEVAPQRPKRA